MSEIFTGPNKVLLVLGRSTSAHREHCKRENFKGALSAKIVNFCCP